MLQHSLYYEEIDKGQRCLKCNECRGFKPHSWRKRCVSCNCTRNDHDIRFSRAITLADRIGDATLLHDDVKAVALSKSLGYSWVPSGLNREQVEKYFSTCNPDDVPQLGKLGERKRERRLLQQIPLQDIDPHACNTLKESGSIERFLKMKAEMISKFKIAEITVLEYAKECDTCNEKIKKNMPVVTIMIGCRKLYWHPPCFKCIKCNDILVDLACCALGFNLYCVRDFNDHVRLRCSGCDELILSSNYLKAMQQNWHTDHLSCWACDSPLIGTKFIVKGEQTYCISCFNNKFSNMCFCCKTKIAADSKDLSYQGKHWHETCFICIACSKPLEGKSFALKNDVLLCPECYINVYASACYKCGNIFKPGTKKMAYKDKEFHEYCFTCDFCSIPIGSNSFLRKDDKIYCSSCYEELCAPKCHYCKKIINEDGVKFKAQTYHNDCFKCENCKVTIAGRKFLTENDNPYCFECFTKIFAKKCYACSLPIIGLDGSTKYIDFEDRQWHNSCFVCCHCRESLVNRRFITEGLDILCTKCATL